MSLITLDLQYHQTWASAKLIVRPGQVLSSSSDLGKLKAPHQIWTCVKFLIRPGQMFAPHQIWASSLLFIRSGPLVCSSSDPGHWSASHQIRAIGLLFFFFVRT
ncbi:hypothetical protein BgiBS90_012713 [Biomphalaria glabrata]|nr:hypothetical protein BgiBS90_012713 [Biomphalaria glabrata]